jgi:membrane fusion protein, heavy metal efflux system
MPPSTTAVENPPQAMPPTPSRGAIRNALPTVAVAVVLGLLAYWGIRTGWTLPKFSSLMGNGGQTKEQWCEEHSVLESECIECNLNLAPYGKDYGWCKEHGVYQCPLHHPDVAQLKKTPQVTQADFDRANRALSIMPRTENNSRCKLHQRRIQFASAEAIEKAGVDIAVVEEQPIVEAIIANGEVVYDRTREAHLASRVSGTVWRVYKKVGDHVKAGDVLALIDGAEIGKAKSEFMQAIGRLRLSESNVDHLKPLADEGIVEGRKYREAEAAMQEAQIRLLGAQQALSNLDLSVQSADFAKATTREIAERIQFLGLPKEVKATLEPSVSTTNLYPVRASLDGVVVDCHVVAGEVVDTSTMLFALADTSRMWLTIDVRQDDARYVTPGKRVLFKPSESNRDLELTGTVTWISTAADERTRTIKVRVELPNDDGRLRANTFGTARIVLREEPRTIMVPSEAVHWDGTCNVVFVRDKRFFEPKAPKFFHVRTVRVGAKSGEKTEIIAGLLPGEVIASKNSVVLEAQLLKSNLGAGCCEVHTK